MTTNRIQTIAKGITKEMISLQTHIFYDPVIDRNFIAFQAQPCLYQTGKFMSPAGDYEVLQRDMTSLANECLGQGVDPVTGADLSKISVDGLVSILKSAFATLWDGQVASKQASSEGN